MKSLTILLLLSNVVLLLAGSLEEEKYGVKFATDCEVCKLVTNEVTELLKTYGSSGVIETGYNLDSKTKKKTKYNKSELKLIEVLEETCSKMLDYRIHKQRTDSTRWEKTMSETFKTLHGLVNKGVKVELGIPMELWDDPSAEVAQLKTQCEQFVEDNEDSLVGWYFGDRSSSLTSDLCGRVLADTTCLSDIPPSPEKENNKENTVDKSKNRQKAKIEL